MSLTKSDMSQLNRIISMAQKLIARHGNTRTKGNGARQDGKRIRRTGKELAKFRKLLKTERQNGTSVAQLARKHGVSSAYIYMLR